MNFQFDLSEMEFRLFRDFIHEKFGIYFKDEKRSFMRMKLYPRVMTLGFKSFNQYFQFIRHKPDGEKELTRMISLLTNTETYFFREMPQLIVFRDFLLPGLRKKKLEQGDKNIRILSAGCSTGEEVYTLAMLTFETGSFFWGWDVQITGLDVNEKALDTARRGTYYERSFRMTEPKYMNKFFSPNSGNFEAKHNIKRLTSFVYGNITEPLTWESMNNLDIIFCRNVLIYFSEDKLKAVINNFYNALRDHGCLLLGHSETLTGIFDKFVPERYPETLVYRKKCPGNNF